MSKIKKIFIFIYLFLLIAPFSHAVYVIDMWENNAGVIAVGKGKLNLEGLGDPDTFKATTLGCSFVQPSLGIIALHEKGNKPVIGWTRGISGPANLGPGPRTLSCETDNSTGDVFQVGAGALLVSPTYLSNTFMSSSVTWPGATLASLGLVGGNYIYSFGITPNDDKIIINIIPPPEISSLSPNAGPLTGTSVVITGTYFTGVLAVKFGTTNATAFTVDSPTQITATAPAADPGTVDVTVVTVGGTSSISSSDQFTYVVRQTPVMNVATGTGTVFAQIVNGSPGCTFDLANTSTIATPNYNGISPPLGGLKIKVTGCAAGETIRLAVTFSNLRGMTAMKYGPTPTSAGTAVWYTPANLSVSGNTISYDVTDNGIGDDTFTGPDGVINDPIIPLIVATNASSIPTLNEVGVILLILLMCLMGAWRIQK